MYNTIELFLVPKKKNENFIIKNNPIIQSCEDNSFYQLHTFQIMLGLEKDTYNLKILKIHLIKKKWYKKC